jgi:DNA-binding GntR family transcriptional regulator
VSVEPAEPLQIESVVDRVYAVLRRRIVEGELRRGARLRQEALAEELGVSRTPLREALRRLAAEGLVEFHPNRGAQVPELTLESVRAAYEARLIVEPGAARVSAARRPAEQLAAMRAAVDLQRGAAGLEAYGASRAFHLALVRASENEYLIRLAEALWGPGLAQAIYEQHRDAQERLVTDVAEHERILAAVEAGDGDLAEALTRHHIAGAIAEMLRHRHATRPKAAAVTGQPA